MIRSRGEAQRIPPPPSLPSYPVFNNLTHFVVQISCFQSIRRKYPVFSELRAPRGAELRITCGQLRTFRRSRLCRRGGWCWCAAGFQRGKRNGVRWGRRCVWRLLHDQDTWWVKNVGVILKRIFSLGSEMGEVEEESASENLGGASRIFNIPPP